jgi:hypothetical protein
MFNDLRREKVVRLVDTGGIVDHHYISASNKNVDIKFSGEDAFLEYYSNLHQKERSCVQKVYVKFVYVIFGQQGVDSFQKLVQKKDETIL